MRDSAPGSKVRAARSGGIFRYTRRLSRLPRGAAVGPLRRPAMATSERHKSAPTSLGSSLELHPKPVRIK